MAIVRLTQEDILQTKLVEAADWYRCKVKESKVEAAKSDQSTNYVFYCVIVDGKELGVPVRCSFSEKFLGPFEGFKIACGGDPGPGAFDTDGFNDKELYIFVEPKENPRDKKIYNTPNGFMSIADFEASQVGK